MNKSGSTGVDNDLAMFNADFYLPYRNTKFANITDQMSNGTLALDGRFIVNNFKVWGQTIPGAVENTAVPLG